MISTLHYPPRALRKYVRIRRSLVKTSARNSPNVLCEPAREKQFIRIFNIKTRGKEESSDVFDELSPKRADVSRRKSIIKDPARKSLGGNRKTVSFGSLPTELTVRSAKDCLKHMYSASDNNMYIIYHISCSPSWPINVYPLGEKICPRR